jgi:hypothetical protein
MAENRSQHFPSCEHAIAADCVSVELKRQLDVAVAKQSLHSLWVGSDPDKKWREAVAQIMKTESSRIVIHESAVICPSAMKECLP